MESRRLFIAEISETTTEKTLEDYFIKYGDITNSEVIKHRFTGRNRGFGFVTFADNSSCAKALQEEHVILETKVKVDIARPKITYRNCQVDSQISSVINPKRIFVGGLPGTLTSEEFKDYFKSFGTIVHVTIMKHQSGRPRGFGYITFDSNEAVDKVLSMKQHKISDKFVEVKRAQCHRTFEPLQSCTYNSHSCGTCYCYGYGFAFGYNGGMWALNPYCYHGFYDAGAFSCFGSNYSYEGSTYTNWCPLTYGASFNKKNVPNVVSLPIRITAKLDEIDGVKGTKTDGASCDDASNLMVNESPPVLNGVNSHLKENGIEDQNGICTNVDPVSHIHEDGVDGEYVMCNNLEVQVVEYGVEDRNGSCSEFETTQIEPDSSK